MRTSAWFSFLLAAGALLACDDDTRTSSGSSGGPSSNASASSASSSTTATSASSGGGGDGGSGVGGMGGTGGMGGAGGGEQGYRAFGYSGGLEHLAIVKFDTASDTCVRVFLAAPMQSSTLPINTPAQWGIVSAEMGLGAGSCKPTSTLTTPFEANGGSGTISWIPPMMCAFCLPTTVDINATLTFPAGPPWLPATEPLVANGLVVEPWL